MAKFGSIWFSFLNYHHWIIYLKIDTNIKIKKLIHNLKWNFIIEKLLEFKFF